MKILKKMCFHISPILPSEGYSLNHALRAQYPFRDNTRVPQKPGYNKLYSSLAPPLMIILASNGSGTRTGGTVEARPT